MTSIYNSVCCCTDGGGGGGGDPPEREIFNLSITNNKIYSSGDIFPPVQFTWDANDVYHPDDMSLFEFDSTTQTLFIKDGGQFLLTQTMYHQIEADTTPALSKINLYAVDDINLPTTYYLSTQGIPSGVDQTSVHTATKIINVAKDAQIQWAVSVSDPTPAETITIVASGFGGDDRLTNFTIERISKTPQLSLDVKPSI